ncbi:HdeA/HdeB family chaperone [Hyphomicrobium facile]|uniref:HdeA/HdeB family protein n=1 Tax=Hyphomicrobium facile TaxID=51670 RepID=A0A1I7MXZ3_9HYPH|nr:HdeA/HdeB family chaperone [Hyphomicrobium facile]SFV27282.1 HdeA/HdeB family protein [Hyphomicrobium facile]
MRTLLSAVTAALLLATSFNSASAETIDASTLTCHDLIETAASSEKASVYGATVVLYWMAGYQATAEQGTVVDFDNLSKEFSQTTEFCGQNPTVGVMSASEKFMGENAEDQTSKAIDLAILKCEAVNTTKEDETEGLGQILMWLAGYHASVAKSTVIDMDKFSESVSKMATYCAENPQMGLFTASEKFMSEEGDGE